MPLDDGIGCWSCLSPDACAVNNTSALFLDRDGVVMEDTHFPSQPDDVAVLPGAAKLIRTCNEMGIPVIIVTNQSGIARGLVTWPQFELVQRTLAGHLARLNARVDATFACGYHASGDGPLRDANHPWRKPNPGMLLVAADRLGIALERSWIVGDRAIDLEAGRSAGLAGGLHVATGKGTPEQRELARELATSSFEVSLSANLEDATHLVDVLKEPPRAD